MITIFKCFSVVVPEVQSPESSCDIVCENDVCRIVRKEQTNSNGATTSVNEKETKELTPEDRVERAKELIEEKRKEKEREEKEVSYLFIILISACFSLDYELLVFY